MQGGGVLFCAFDASRWVYCLACSCLTQLPCFFFWVSCAYQEADALLRQHGFSEGLFLVRDKGDGGLSYVITIVHKRK
jgi:hypothetical protein